MNKKKILLVADTDERCGMGHIIRAIEYSRPFAREFDIVMDYENKREDIKRKLKQSGIKSIDANMDENIRDLYQFIIVDSYLIKKEAISSLRLEYKKAKLIQIIDFPGSYEADVAVTYTQERKDISLSIENGMVLAGIEFNPVSYLHK